MMKLVQNLGLIALATLAAFAITAVGQGLWGVMAMVNVTLTPAIPWCAGVMPAVLGMMVLFLAGRLGPKWGAKTRRALIPSAPVSARAWGWSLAAGGAGVIAAAALWTVLATIVRVPPNLLPDLKGVPVWSQQAMLLVAIAAAHLTQGLYAPKLGVYFLAGLLFGAIALRTGSLLPAMVVHSFGDFTFFTLVWSHDAGRKLITEGGADTWFYANLVLVAVFTPLCLLAFRQLVQATGGTATARRPSIVLSAA